jgi:hypothetical protein
MMAGLPTGSAAVEPVIAAIRRAVRREEVCLMSPVPASGSASESEFGSRGSDGRTSAIRSAPPELLLFGLFSALVCAADMWLSFWAPRA